MSQDQRIASVDIDRNPVEGSLVGDKVIPVAADTLVEGGSTVQIEHKRSVGDKESPVVGGTAFLAVVASMVHLVVEDKAGPVAGGEANLAVERRVNPVVVEGKASLAAVGTVVVVYIQTEGSDMRIRPEAAETV